MHQWRKKTNGRKETVKTWTRKDKENNWLEQEQEDCNWWMYAVWLNAPQWCDRRQYENKEEEQEEQKKNKKIEGIHIWASLRLPHVSALCTCAWLVPYTDAHNKAPPIVRDQKPCRMLGYGRKLEANERESWEIIPDRYCIRVQDEIYIANPSQQYP